MSVVINLDGLDHWVTHVRFDGSSDGHDYDMVHIVCRPPMRFARPVVLVDTRLYAPLRNGVPTCIKCYRFHHPNLVIDDDVATMGVTALMIFRNTHSVHG